MIIGGAGGHGLEVLGILEQNRFDRDLFFFDDTRTRSTGMHFGRPLLHSLEEARQRFTEDPGFVIGVGNPSIRMIIADKLMSAGGVLQSAISCQAVIGIHDINLGEGLNIFSGAVLTGRISVGKGSLIHVHASLHHDVSIGEFCELSPGCRLLGGVELGNMVSIGAGAVVLPGVHIGHRTIVGAGAVVTRNIGENQVIYGVPAKPGKK